MSWACPSARCDRGSTARASCCNNDSGVWRWTRASSSPCASRSRPGASIALAAAEMALVRQHLEVCALCSAEFAFEASVIRDVKPKLQRIDVPGDFRSRVAKRLAAGAAK